MALQTISRWLVAVLLVCGIAAGPAAARQAFPTPEAAAGAFGKAVSDDDSTALKALLGKDFRRFVPPPGAWVRDRFVAAWHENRVVRHDSDRHATLEVGTDGWTLPIPLVATAAGWTFDTAAGAEEMRVRRIGRHERVTIGTLRAVLDAQRDYAQVDRDGDGMLNYADRLVSSPGRHDGLYWPTVAGEAPAPLGPAFVGAEARNAGAAGLFGYRYRLLDGQGAHAEGGVLSYRVRGKLFGGFAVVAYPVRYGETGVMSFLMNHDGRVYQRDLGPDGATRAARLSRFDPGPGWAEVTP